MFYTLRVIYAWVWLSDQPSYRCMRRPTISVRGSRSVLEMRKQSRVRRMRTSSIEVTSQFLIIHSSSATVVEPQTGVRSPLLTSSAREPKVLQSWTPMWPFYFRSRCFRDSGAEPKSLRPLVWHLGMVFPFSCSLAAMWLTKSSPIFRQIVHFPPIRLSSPLFDSSITWFRAIVLVSFPPASSITKDRSPLYRVFQYCKKVPTSSPLINPVMALLMKVRSESEQLGLLVGAVKVVSVVPARIRPSQGCTRMIRPSALGAAIPKVELARRSSQTTWLPPTMQIRGLASGSSIWRTASAQAPVQLTTYFAPTLYSFRVSRSRKTTPFTFPCLSLMNSTNSARLTALPGTKLPGMVFPLPQVAVRMAETHMRASLKEPSSQTTPTEYSGLRWGKMSMSSWRLRRQGALNWVSVEGVYHWQIQQYISEPTQKYSPEKRLPQGITSGTLVVR